MASQTVQFQIHPLVTLNVSDHLTRARWMENSSKTRVIGVLLGKQEGKVMSIVNTIELAFKVEA